MLTKNLNVKTEFDNMQGIIISPDKCPDPNECTNNGDRILVRLHPEGLLTPSETIKKIQINNLEIEWNWNEKHVKLMTLSERHDFRSDAFCNIIQKTFMIGCMTRTFIGKVESYTTHGFKEFNVTFRIGL